MFEIPDNILEVFFREIKKRGKFEAVINGNQAVIIPIEEQQYYKPNIFVKDLEELKMALIHYVEALNEFYADNHDLQHYHNLSYFFNNLFFNMTSSDALDLAKYIDRRTFFFANQHFSEYVDSELILSIDGINFYVQRRIENVGLETPYVLLFYMEVNGSIYNLPLVRYAFDENNVCHLFAIQFGRNRNGQINEEEYKNVVNKVNTSVNKYRNVSPGFVMSFILFLRLLNNYNVTNIVVPDFLFGRYRNYYRAVSEYRSNAVLERILDNYLRLIQRMEYQLDGFVVENYPNEIDSYTHISITDFDSKNKFTKRILEKKQNN